MAEDRAPFSFNKDEISNPTSIDTSEIDDFLGGNPDDVKIIKKKEEEVGPKDKQIDPKAKAKTTQATVEKKEEEDDEDKEAKSDILGFLADDKKGEDDEEEKVETKEEDEDDTLESPKKPDSNIYADFAKELFKVGALTPDTDEETGEDIIPDIESAEGFVAAIQAEGKKQAEITIDRFLSHHGPEFREAFENIFVNGIDPSEYYARQSKISNIQSFDIDSEENQERIVRQLYRSEGKPTEYIDKRIEKMKGYGDLKDEAELAKAVLVKKEQEELQGIGLKKQQESQQKADQKAAYTASMARILNEKIKEKSFDGIPVNKQTAEQLFAYLTKDKYETSDKRALTEFDKDIMDLLRPEQHALRVKMALLLQMAKKDPTLSALQKSAITKESNKLFQNLEAQYGKKKLPAEKTVKEGSNSNW